MKGHTHKPLARHHLDHWRRQHRHRRARRRAIALIVLGLGFLVVLLGYRYRQQLAITYYEATHVTSLPPATVAPTTPNTGTDTQSDTPLPTELNLAVPFTSQAPHGVWDEAHEDYCEEASALMAARFFSRTPITGPDDADAAMVKLHEWQMARFGYFESTTAAETKQMIEANFPLSVTLSRDVTADAIRRALATNTLVLVPAAGQLLKNPYFTQPGPVYHMLVIKGYTAKGDFITNDPGTRHGADYRYDPATLLAAVGDWNNGDPAHGAKVLLLVSPRS